MSDIYGLGDPRSTSVNSPQYANYIQPDFHHYIIRVYDMNSVLIQKYNGLYIIQTYDNEKVVFIDKDNKSHIFYLKNGIVIIDEV